MNRSAWKKSRNHLAGLALCLLLAPGFSGWAVAAAEAPGGFRHVELDVDGVSRELLLYAPPQAKQESTPVVFVFHGHGGNMRNAARTFAFHRHWPGAICVCMQGLPTPGRLTDPEGRKSGWQSRPGDQGDRDLKFFDAVLAKLQTNYRVDERRIYSTGHSNGGGFTYLLWAARGDVLAAVAPSSAASARAPRKAALMKPKPVMHIAGESDALVKFEWQQLSMQAVKKINGCRGDGRPWHDESHCLLYDSENGTPFVSVIHPGGHKFLKEAPPLIAKFFQEH